jgi:hypothetical protein
MQPLFNAFPLDSNSRFVMIYRGGKSFDDWTIQEEL